MHDPAASPLAAGGRNLGTEVVLLDEAARFADELGRPARDFAVELRDLRSRGTSLSGLHRLVCVGILEHLRETTTAEEAVRRFEQAGSSDLGPGSCFALTDLDKKADGVRESEVRGMARNDARSRGTSPRRATRVVDRSASSTKGEGPMTTVAESRRSLAAEHDRLAERIDVLHRWGNELAEFGLPRFGEMGARIAAFRAELAAHFAHEERSELHAANPALVRLHTDHDRLLRELDDLVARLRACEPEFECWSEARDAFDAFLDRLSGHEQAEAAVLERETADVAD